jgi:CBS domain-containing protein
MKVRDIMTRSTQTILLDATIEQAARKMRDANIGLLPVVEEGKVLGAVTDRDIVIRSVAEGRNPHLTTVRDVMTEGVLYCYEDQSIAEASMIMEEHHVRRLLVMDAQNRLAGMLTVTDLALKGNEKLPGHVLNRVAGPV